MPTLGPCLQDQKDETTEILLALPGLGVLAMSQGDPAVRRAPAVSEMPQN